MHQREQEKCAQDRRTATKLRDIAAEISGSRDLVEVAFMAAHKLERHERDPFVELLAIISDRLKAVAAEITTQADASHQEGSTNAA